jgi:hypothetical protein
MATDVTHEIGVHDDGLDQLLAALAAPGEPTELRDEQAALTLFRSAGRGRAGGHGAAWPAEPGTFATRPLLRPARWSPRLTAAAAAAVVVVGGITGAAYAAALPTPVQHLVHDVFRFAGVPDAQPLAGTGPRGSQRSAQLAPGASVSAAPTAAVPGASGSPGPTAPAGAASLSATADNTMITAGAGVVITGRLSWPGHALGGVTVTLLQRPALTLAWRAVGSVPVDAEGNGAVAVPVVATNAVFRLAVSGVAISPDVRVTVVPAIAASLQVGSAGRADVMTVSAPYAQGGDVVELQVSTGGGSWTDLRNNPVTASGTTAFVIDATRLAKDQVRAVLLATGLHAGAASQPVTVPPPG